MLVVLRNRNGGSVMLSKCLALVVGLVNYGGMAPVLGQVYATVSPGENLRISVTGYAKGSPDTMHIELASEATAGNAADAFQQCKQKADGAANAIAALKIPGCQVLRQMYEFSSPTAGSPYTVLQPTAAPAGTKVSQVITVKVRMGDASDMDGLAQTISQVFDAANKAGVGLKQASAWEAQLTGQAAASPVKYVLEDATALRKQAIADALADANEMKDGLIASGIGVGRLVGVACYQDGAAGAIVWPQSTLGKNLLGEKSASSGTPEEVVVRCSLTLTYELERAEEGVEMKQTKMRTEAESARSSRE
jgi:uncharacterized protein YggE